jgi:DNA-binding response OmpR family regulator
VDTDARPSPQDTTLHFGRLAVDLAGYTVTVDGRVVSLTLTQFVIFKELVLQPHRVVDRARLYAVMDERPFDYRHGQPPETLRAVDIHVSRLRKKLARAGYDCIETMRFVGYRFVPEELPSYPPPPGSV